MILEYYKHQWRTLKHNVKRVVTSKGFELTVAIGLFVLAIVIGDFTHAYYLQ